MVFSPILSHRLYDRLELSLIRIHYQCAFSMHALDIANAWDRFWQAYMFAKFGPHWGTIFGKGGPLLTAE